MPSAGRAATKSIVRAGSAPRPRRRAAMNRTCIVVADAGRARFYGVAATNAPRVKTTLVEKTVLTNELDLRARGESVTGKVRTETNSDRGSGPVHPMAAQ